MANDVFVNELKASKHFLDRGTDWLTKEHEAFAPTEGSMTSAQQLAHIAHTVEWFVEGAFGEGFDLDFESQGVAVSKIQTLEEARAWCDRAYAKAIDTFGTKTEEEISAPIPDGPIMGGAPKLAIVNGIVDHTAHHRGALTVYARLCGKAAAMPYE